MSYYGTGYSEEDVYIRRPRRDESRSRSREYRRHYYSDSERSDDRRERIVVRRRVYEKPRHVFDVDLRNVPNLPVPLSSRQEAGLKRDNTRKILARHHFEGITHRQILSIRQYTDAEARSKAIVQTQTQSAQASPDYAYNWIHLQAENRTVRDLDSFVTALAELDSDERAMTAQLLKKASATMNRASGGSKRPYHGNLRCDGHGAASDKWVNFVSMPCLREGPIDKMRGSSQLSHRASTLSEYMYPYQDDTHARDALQVLHEATTASDIIYLDSVWMLLYSSGTLITYSADTADTLPGQSIQLEDLSARAEGGLKVIRVLDPAQRMFFIQISECKTWFALMDRIVALCGNEYGQKHELYHVCDKHRNEITASDWQKFISAQKTSSATLLVSIASHTPPPPPPIPASDRYDGSDRRTALVQVAEDIARRTRASSRSRRRSRDSVYLSRGSSVARDEVRATVLHADFPVLQANNKITSTHESGSPTEVETTKTSATMSAAQHLSESPDRIGNDQDIGPRSYAHERKVNHGQSGATGSTYRKVSRTATAQSTTQPQRDWRSVALVPYAGPRDEKPRDNQPVRSQPLRQATQTIVEERRIRNSSPSPTRRRRSRDYERDDTERVTPAPPPRQDMALVRVPEELGLEERKRHRRDPPAYRIESTDPRIFNTDRLGAPFEYIFYLPEEAIRAAKIGRLVRGHNEEDRSEPMQEATSHPMKEAKEEEKPNQPEWKSTAVDEKAERLAIPPVFLWHSARSSDDANQSADVDIGTYPSSSGEADTAGPEITRHSVSDDDIEILQLILAQIDKNLAENTRFSAAPRGSLTRLEPAIYKGLRSSSKSAAERGLHQAGCSTYDSETFENDTVVHGHDPMQKLRLSFEILSTLLAFFLPLDYPSDVLTKYWDGMTVLVKRVGEMLSVVDEDNSSTFVQRKDVDSKHRPSHHFYIVNAQRHPRNTRSVETLDPYFPLAGCDSCDRRISYESLAAAQLHLRQSHFKEITPTDDQLTQWICRGDQVDKYQIESDAMHLLDVMLDHLTMLKRLKQDILAGVTINGTFDAGTYRVPNGLVKAFERLFMFLAFSAWVASETYEVYTRNPGRYATFLESDHLNHIIELGYATEAAFEESKSNLMLMNRVNDYSSSVRYDSVGLEYFVLLLLADTKDNITKARTPALPWVYMKHLYQLAYEVDTHPRRRLLRDLQRLSEEAAAISLIQGTSHEVIDKYIAHIDPSGFQTTTAAREMLFDNYEERLYLSNLADASTDKTPFDLVVEGADKVSKQLLESIEIQQEDHGKAILVFTIVTLIFLPLSFVTGFFGMSTTDIRNLEYGQWIFWATGLPLTALIIGVSMYIAYRGEYLRDRLSGVSVSKPAQRARRGRQDTGAPDREKEKRSQDLSGLESV